MNNDHDTLKTAAIRFASKKLNDNMIERDKKNKFSVKGWKAGAQFGLQGLLPDKIYGGTGLDLPGIVAVLEGIGYGCKDNGLVASINAHIWGCELPLCHFGTDEQKRRYLPGLCKGKLIGASAATESDSGSDVFAMKTTAKKEKDRYVLNGSKAFVTNAPIADLFVVFARTGKGKGFSGISCFLVEKGADGLSTGKQVEKMGLRTSPMSDISFTDCAIHKNNLIGREGSGSIIFNDSMEWERMFITASLTGVMERLLESCVAYAKSREVFNRKIGGFQAISNKITDMHMRLEAGRMLLYKAVWLKHNKKSALTESAMANLSITESLVKSSRETIQIFGGYGYMVESELERELRDAVASTIYSGTSEVLKNSIYQALQ